MRVPCLLGVSMVVSVGSADNRVLAAPSLGICCGLLYPRNLTYRKSLMP